MILLEDRLVLEAKDKMIMSMIKREREKELRIMKTLLVTGAAGFICSHVCEAIIKQFPKSKVFVLDKLTYAGNINFIINRK